jgi:formylglycine-generating enzyme required for sulfatase activity
MYLGRKVEETVEIANGVTMTFVLVPPGRFLMGSPPGEAGREPFQTDETLHEVTLKEPFYMGTYEVTQEQYEALVGKSNNPSGFKGPVRPVESVGWDDCQAYCRTLTLTLHDKHVYRLPTEAEWEYACRAGRSSHKAFGVGDGESLSSTEANFHGNYPYGGAAKGPYLNGTSKVGSYRPNALGLYDMHGNVAEWCHDWYGKYPTESVTDPTGPDRGPGRVLRGASWDVFAQYCRSANRAWFLPSRRGSGVGFRLARGIPSDGK